MTLPDISRDENRRKRRLVRGRSRPRFGASTGASPKGERKEPTPAARRIHAAPVGRWFSQRFALLHSPLWSASQGRAFRGSVTG